ncbi:hypothetical protein SEA_NEFERTHENA_45 [Microbacterium phage Neferthena]|uniref:Uncharacterized protein n=1 Tax=Microbacterium phage Neferthena TaxID=2301539 RepID=A0A385D3F9_9CAUD|nr:hypothetical protein HOT92_gp57 [Microbacterium phage Neferthena]AXQ52908.1 hypothetical protein SEA_NEFERTHENA_45 [Microbacterium phage Neferthena]
MSTRQSASAARHLDHLFQIGVLITRSQRPYPRATRQEAIRELDRYWDQGLIIQKTPKEDNMGKPMTKSGFCQHESPGSHAMCNNARNKCDCDCHKEQKAFSGRGILFAVIDEREAMRMGKTTTVDVIADAIEAALDNGKETSEEIARYLVTSAFQHIPDKRVRFNSILKAGDSVGAHLVRKLFNSYNELMDTAAGEKNASARAALEAEATGFAEAVQIILNPFSVEDDNDPTLVKWEEVDRLTELYEKEQRGIRAARNKK